MKRRAACRLEITTVVVVTRSRGESRWEQAGRTAPTPGICLGRRCAARQHRV